MKRYAGEIALEVLHELAPSGSLRVAINHGNPVLAQQDPESKALGGVSVDLARELARELHVEAELVPFGTAGNAFESVASGRCDIGFLAIDPVRAEKVSYTAPYVLIHGGYLVRKDSAFLSVNDVDKPGVKVSAGRNTAYDLHLSRTLKHASLVHTTTSADTVDLLVNGEADVAAGICEPLAQVAAREPGFRMADGHFMVIQQAMVVRKARRVALAYIRDFIERAKLSGFVADALSRSGQVEAQVAPSLRA
ncbi:transporter substrate-binding domain-containing protein [Burkholderia sp. MR1-5-21]